MSIFLRHWPDALWASENSNQSHMVSYCSAIKATITIRPIAYVLATLARCTNFFAQLLNRYKIYFVLSFTTLPTHLSILYRHTDPAPLPTTHTKNKLHIKSQHFEKSVIIK